jgi:hypothetical protein
MQKQRIRAMYEEYLQKEAAEVADEAEVEPWLNDALTQDQREWNHLQLQRHLKYVQTGTQQEGPFTQDELAEVIADKMPKILDESEASMRAFGITLDKYLRQREEDFNRLREMEKPEGWNFSTEVTEVKIYTKALMGGAGTNSVFCFKGVLDCKKPIETILSGLIDFEERVVYDDLMIKGWTLEKQLPYYRSMYGRFSTGVPFVADRDLVLRAVTSYEQDGSVLIHIQSIAELDCPEGTPPPGNARVRTDQAVRATFVDGGYTIRILGNGVCRVTYMGSIIPNGWIPEKVGNLTMWKQALVLQHFSKWLSER